LGRQPIRTAAPHNRQELSSVQRRQRKRNTEEIHPAKKQTTNKNRSEKAIHSSANPIQPAGGGAMQQSSTPASSQGEMFFELSAGWLQNIARIGGKSKSVAPGATVGG